MSDELVAFLTARIDEREAKAHRVEPNYAPNELRVMVTREGSEPFLVVDSPRVLREVDTKRRIIAEHANQGGNCRRCASSDVMHITYDPETNEETVTWPVRPMAYPCPTLRLLALLDDAHPDYRNDWRP